MGFLVGVLFGYLDFFAPNPRGPGPNPVGWAKLRALKMTTN